MSTRSLSAPEYTTLPTSPGGYSYRLRVQHVAYGSRRYYGWSLEYLDPWTRTWGTKECSGEDTKAQALAAAQAAYDTFLSRLPATH